MKQLTVRAGKGDKDRCTTFPATLTPLLQNHLAGVKALHQQNVSRAWRGVPHSLGLTLFSFLLPFPSPPLHFPIVKSRCTKRTLR
jgi:hypothetical protein